MGKLKTGSITSQFIKWYTFILLAVVSGITVAVISTVSIFLFQETKSDSHIVKEKIEEAASAGQVNWGLFMEEYIYQQYLDYVMKIEIPDTGKIFYSRDWQDFFDDDDTFIELPFLGTVFWHGEEGLFYEESIALGTGEIVTIYFPLENITDFIKLLSIILFIVVSIATLVGIALIIMITKKNIRPIIELTDSVKHIDFKKDFRKGVAVPENPQEIADLGNAFNSLMLELDSYIENEKSFVANASHELRTPIAAIHGNVNLIRRRGKQHPEIVDSSLEAIHQESIRMETLLAQLLAMAKLENFEAEKSRVDISEIVKEAIRSYWKKGKDIALQTNIQDNLFIYGNDEQLRQMCIILLDNAWKYTEEHGNITVALQQEEEGIALKVTDTGIGIAKEEQEKIFHRFYRVDKARARATGGTGLGLTMVKQFAEQHQAIISVNSELGKGAEFTIIFPKA